MGNIGSERHVDITSVWWWHQATLRLVATQLIR